MLDKNSKLPNIVKKIDHNLQKSQKLEFCLNFELGYETILKKVCIDGIYQEIGEVLFVKHYFYIIDCR